jgi:hypothetical protein
MNKVRLLSVRTIKGIERRSAEVVPESPCKVFIVALFWWWIRGTGSYRELAVLIWKKEWSLFRLLSAMITEEFEVLLYIKFATLWPSWSGTSHGMMQLYDFITLYCYQTQKCKKLEFQKEKRHYSLFEQNVLNDLQMLFCLHGDLNFFLLLPVFMANVYTVFAFHTHTKYLSQKFMWQSRQWCVDGQRPRSYQQYRTDRSQKDRLCPRHT